MVPEIDYDNYAGQVLPTAQRKPKWLIFVKALLSAIKNTYNIFVGYKDGEALNNYAAGTTYAKGEKVIFSFATWQSLQDSNTGNTPDSSPSFWVKLNDSFIGATERSLFSGRYLPLTRALNRQFQTTFRQPPYPAPYDYGLGGGTFSDIYITNDNLVYISFLVGQTTGSSVGQTKSSGYVTQTEIFGTASSYKFVIYFPIAVFNALGTTDPIRESVVRKFVDGYNVSGISYRIVTY